MTCGEKIPLLLLAGQPDEIHQHWETPKDVETQALYTDYHPAWPQWAPHVSHLLGLGQKAAVILGLDGPLGLEQS